MSGELPGGFRLAKRIDDDVSKSPYVIPVVSNFLLRALLVCMVASILATMYLILFGSVTGRNIKSLSTDNNTILCGLAQDDIKTMREAKDPLADEIEAACKRLLGP